MPFPVDLVTELFVGGRWVDVSTDVLTGDRVTITRGRPNESGRVPPCECALSLLNTSGDYAPRNAMGSWYGSIGRNTPMRVAVGTITDSFTRTVSNGWGGTDTGQAWTSTGSSGVVAADFAVSSGQGTHSVPAAAAFRLSYLNTMLYRDVDVRVDVTLPVTDVTGGTLEPANIILRRQSGTDYYLVRVTILTTEAVTIGILHVDGTEIAAPVTVSGLTHSSSAALRVRAQVEGQTIRGKVWAAAAGEPYDWQVRGHTEQITVAGRVGVRSGAGAGNSNSKPIVFSYDNFVVTIPRCSVEIATWPQRRDPSENFRFVPVQAAGIRRRLGDGVSPLQSTLRRGILTLPTPAVAYWPGEDGAESTFLASALGGPAMVLDGPTDFAGYDKIPASGPLPKFTDTGCTWIGAVPPYASTGKIQVRFLVHVPSGGIPDLSHIAALICGGTAGLWEIKYRAGGNMSLEIWSGDNGVQLHDTGSVAFGLDDQHVLISLEITQNGANIDWRLATLRVGQTTGGFIGATLAAHTITVAREVRISPAPDLPPAPAVNGLTVGHIPVLAQITSLFDLASEINAFTGERAGRRLQRLCAQEGIPFSWVGDLDATAPMGPQRVRALLDLLDECAEADGGTLYEPRGEVGFCYRTRASLYNQTPTVTLDYAAGHLAPPWEPIDDNTGVYNDITVEREGGSSARAVLKTGRMSILPPHQGGIGRRATAPRLNIATDAQLPDLASWMLHVSTVNESRYPAITVDLALPAVVAAGLEPALLDVDVDDRVTVDNPPSDQGLDLVSQLARGYVETIGLYEHTLEINGSPESAYQVAELDHPDKRLDSHATTLAEDLDPTEPDVTVTITDGTPWTTDPAQMPIPIMVGGEEMAITAVTGAVPTQTFTVTRSVNGVVKSHEVGAEVRVKYPIVPEL